GMADRKIIGWWIEEDEEDEEEGAKGFDFELSGERVPYGTLDMVDKYDGVMFMFKEDLEDLDIRVESGITAKGEELANVLADAYSLLKRLMSDLEDRDMAESLFGSLHESVKKHHKGKTLIVKVASNLPQNSCLYEGGGPNGESVLVLNEEFAETTKHNYLFRAYPDLADIYGRTLDFMSLGARVARASLLGEMASGRWDAELARIGGRVGRYFAEFGAKKGAFAGIKKMAGTLSPEAALYPMCERLNHEFRHSSKFGDYEYELKDEINSVFGDYMLLKYVLLARQNRRLKKDVSKYTRTVKRRFHSGQYYKFLYSLVSLGNDSEVLRRIREEVRKKYRHFPGTKTHPTGSTDVRTYALEETLAELKGLTNQLRTGQEEQPKGGGKIKGGVIQGLKRFIAPSMDENVYALGIAPLIEEGLFRGLSQLALLLVAPTLAITMPLWGFVAVQGVVSILFLLAHIPGNRSPPSRIKRYLAPGIVTVVNALIIPFLSQDPIFYLLYSVASHTIVNLFVFGVNKIFKTNFKYAMVGSQDDKGKEDHQPPSGKKIDYHSKEYRVATDKTLALIKEAWQELGECRYENALARSEEALELARLQGVYLEYDDETRLDDIHKVSKTILEKGFFIDPMSYTDPRPPEEMPMLRRAVAYLNYSLWNMINPTAEDLEKEVLKWHSILAENSIWAGTYRSERREKAMRSIFHKWMNTPKYTEMRQNDPVAFAAWVFSLITSWHPYGEGDHRTANLLINYFLVTSGYEPFPLALEGSIEYDQIKYYPDQFKEYLRSKVRKVDDYPARPKSVSSSHPVDPQDETKGRQPPKSPSAESTAEPIEPSRFTEDAEPSATPAEDGTAAAEPFREKVKTCIIRSIFIILCLCIPLVWHIWHTWDHMKFPGRKVGSFFRIYKFRLRDIIEESKGKAIFIIHPRYSEGYFNRPIAGKVTHETYGDKTPDDYSAYIDKLEEFLMRPIQDAMFTFVSKKKEKKIERWIKGLIPEASRARVILISTWPEHPQPLSSWGILDNLGIKQVVLIGEVANDLKFDENGEIIGVESGCVGVAYNVLNNRFKFKIRVPKELAFPGIDRIDTKKAKDSTRRPNVIRQQSTQLRNLRHRLAILEGSRRRRNRQQIQQIKSQIRGLERALGLSGEVVVPPSIEPPAVEPPAVEPRKGRKDTPPDGDEIKGGVIQGLKRFIAPSMDENVYALGIAPSIEEGLFRWVLPKIVSAIILSMPIMAGLPQACGFAMGLIASAIFIFMPLHEFGRAPPKDILDYVRIYGAPAVVSVLTIPVMLMIPYWFISIPIVIAIHSIINVFIICTPLGKYLDPATVRPADNPDYIRRLIARIPDASHMPMEHVIRQEPVKSILQLRLKAVAPLIEELKRLGALLNPANGKQDTQAAVCNSIKAGRIACILGLIGTKDAEEEVLKILEIARACRDRNLIIQTIQSLQGINCKTSLPAIEEFLSHKDNTVRSAAVLASAAIGRREALKYIVPALEDLNPRVRNTA
ncbi:MAG: HEAT repeat domain-containing protein, partial [Candidatus Omnitrophica bacterium]|nr:HEAT repeat domain-containing protein [Candidatus Omnitrophota bacterium]